VTPMGIVFTRAWEDDRLDAELLSVAPGERVLVVASAGDAALALAASGADVTAVDSNPDQLRLVALKLAAARALDPLTLHRWFEVGRDAGAPAGYHALVRSNLAADDAAFWDARIGILASGLHEHAGVGRPFARLGQLARILRPGMARAIETTPDIESQAAWWRKHARPRLFGPLTHAVAARTRVLAGFAPNAKELERMRRGGWSHGLADRVDGVVASTLVRRHPWWRPAFSGRPVDPGDGAAWLEPDRIRALAAGSPLLALVGGDLATVLAGMPAASLVAVSVSNVPDWLAAPGTAALAEAVRHALAPGGRVVVRRVVRPDEDDPFVLAGLALDPVSCGLVARERTALYEAVDLYRAPAA
jgi:S-adenosylmethionine:diacylglycerol 3-amino-3-carboxypropyl transferase